MDDIDLEMEPLHHRNVRLAGGTEFESESSGSDDDDDDLQVVEEYDAEEEEEEEDENRVLVDPGPFKYNKRISTTALPCFLLIIGFVGESILTILTVGTVLLILLDRMGEKRRCVILFALIFIPCHILVFVTVAPLIWLSLWNFFLIGAINAYVILTGGWIILLFSAFRTEEPQLAEVIEMLLFSAYPGVSVILITWVLTTVTPISVAPLIFMAVSFVLLQVFLTPAMSSFKSVATGDEDLHVLQQPIILVLTCTFCVAPSLLHVLLCIVASSTDPLFSTRSLIQLSFTICLSLFLATLLSIRQFFEFTGLPYSVVTRGRWVCGMLTAALSYPLLQKYYLLSHFLPWLPVAIVSFTALGFFLESKKYWIPAVALIAGLSCLLGFWMFVLPWHLTFYLLESIPINAFYILLCANFIVCLGSMYVAAHGNKDLLGFLVCLQSILLTLCETALHSSGLYSLSLCVVTTALATYTLQRLHQADKLRLGAVLASSSVHITKGTSCLLTELVLKDKLGLLSHIGLFLLIFAVLQNFVYEPREAVPIREAVRNLVFLLVSLAFNTFPVFTVLCYNLWQDTPTVTDLVGMWFILGGVLVLVFAQIHCEVVSGVRLSGLLMLIVGITILTLQPQCHISMYAMFQWSEIASLLLLMSAITASVSLSVTHIVIIAVITSICISLRVILLLYQDFHFLLYFPLYLIASACVMTVAILYSKADIIKHSTDKTVITCCIVSGASLLLAFILDLVMLQTQVTVLSCPSLKVMLAVFVSLSVLIKLLAVKMGFDFIPVINYPKEKEVKPVLPLVANVVTLFAYLLLGLQGPSQGFLHDMWCCASALIFFCLHQDFRILRNLRAQNVRTPTILVSIGMLFLASVYRSSLWLGGSANIVWGVIEIGLLVPTFPVYVVLWGILWKNEIMSEHLVVFFMPLNGFLYLAGTSYTMWAIASCGLLSGIGMMALKLPMVPYGGQFHTR